MYALDNNQLQRVAPSVFAAEAASSTSDKYRFVPTIAVLEALREEGFFPVAVSTSRSMTDDGKDYVKHSLRLRQANDIGRRMATFEDVIPEIALTNSHNGTSGFTLDAALHRLVCKNGLTVASSQGTLRYRHTGKDDLIGRVIEGTFSIVEDFPKIAESVAAWRQIKLDPQERVAFARAALPLRFDADDAGNFPVAAEKLLTPRRYGDRNEDLWTTFNVTQEALIRGGIYQGYKNGRRQTTRKVGSVDRDLKINRALWTLADEMAKIKATH